jgi:predicted phage terminase large subunit-like protein
MRTHDILWPDREGPAELEAAKIRLGTYGFAAQYQQSPTAREGNLIKLDWLSATYRARPVDFDSTVLSLDTAFKTGDSNDYSAAVVIRTLNAPRDGSPPGHYLLDAWRGKLEFGALIRKVAELCTTWHPYAVLVEDAGSGQSLNQELQSNTNLPVRPIRPDRDKMQRLTAITPELEARRLFLPEAAWWRDEFITELTSFPNGPNDDWCDTLAMALNYLRGGSKAAKWIHAGKLRAAAQSVRAGAPVEEAAAREGVSAAELQHSLDRVRQLLRGSSRFGTPHPQGPAKPKPCEVELLIEASRKTGHYLDINPDVYRLRLRTDFKIYAANCRDPEKQAAALKLIDELDRRFGLS